MFSFLDPKFWLAAISLVLVCTFGGYEYGTHVEGLAAQVRADKADRDARIELDVLTNRAIASERSMKVEINSIETAAKLKDDHAKAEINSLRIAVRNGAVRLSIPVTNKSCATTKGVDTTVTRGVANEERAEILPALADSLIELVGDANAEVRRTNLCIDSYNKVMMLFNKPDLKKATNDH